jgi:hypothetical protein
MDSGIVWRCDAIKCTHNQEQQCTAGAISVTFVDELAECYTYTEEPERVKQVGIEVGEVSQCDVIDCTHNQGERCMAETIIVAYLDDVARCVTYLAG